LTGRSLHDAPRLNELAALLHPPDTPHEDLPLRGFQPPSEHWSPRPAAVLVPILENEHPEVVLTVRSQRMSLHAGQVAFPGGRREDGERFPLDTAIRETSEEIGVSPRALTVHGLLDRFDTITGYRIVPVVASIAGAPDLVPCPREVEHIFTMPLDEVLDAERYRHHRVTRGAHRHDLVTLAHPRWMIWGATAAILHRFCQRVTGA
jgi:8-oxo-dGTP pyrophosphatase MutT (NUDIX family)